MKQLRKFEQDAIVNTITKKININRKIKSKQLVSKRDYLSFEKQIEAIEKAAQKVLALVSLQLLQNAVVHCNLLPEMKNLCNKLNSN